jgi:hypothetical protein
MATTSKCRFGLHLGLDGISYVKLGFEGPRWHIASCGDISWDKLSSSPEQCEGELRDLLKNMVRQEGIQREPLHVSLHNRLCVTRILTGNRDQVEQQLAEVLDNSQHYLQLGLGEKLIGHATIPIDETREYGQVAIIKRGLIETIESASMQAGLALESVDGSLTSVCRLTGVAGLDKSPLLIVWLGSDGVEIGISYKGRLQLNYHASAGETAQQAAETISRHLKRLRRFCDRYRQVDGGSDLRRVLVLAPASQTSEFERLLTPAGFERIYSARDLQASVQTGELNEDLKFTPGVACALGGLLVHIEEKVFPATDVYSKYLSAKPRSLLSVVVKDGWPVLVAAACLLAMIGSGWWMQWQIASIDTECLSLNTSFDDERAQLLELDAARGKLNEYQRLDQFVRRPAIRGLVELVAGCLPEDTRLDWMGVDAGGELILKGTMLNGDRTYEVLRTLRDLDVIGEVALESVGRAANFSRTATLFEIHCELTEQATKTKKPYMARGLGRSERR